MNYIVLATDDNPQYFNFVPITAASWMRLGFEPFIICVNTEKEPRCFGEFVHIKDERIKSSRVAMPARFVVARDYVDDNDILMTSDADSIAIQAPFLEEAIQKANEGLMVSIEHDWQKFNIVAAWYLLATAKTWRELFYWSIEELITENLPELLGESGYSFDERLAYKVYQKNKERFHFIFRKNEDRINASDLKNVIDIHCHIGPRVFEL